MARGLSRLRGARWLPMIGTGGLCLPHGRCTIHGVKGWLEVCSWALAVMAAMSVSLLVLVARGPAWHATEALSMLAMAGSLMGLLAAVRERRGGRAPRGWLQAITENLPDILFDAQPDGALRAVSTASQSLLGYAPEELAGRHVCSITTDPLPDLGPRTPGNEPIVWNTRWIHANGDRIPLSAQLRPVRDASGQLVAIQGLVRDHRDRLAAEEALRDSEERFRRVLDTAQNGVLLVSHDGRLLLTNDALRSLLGYQVQDMRRLTLADIIHPVYLDQVTALMASRMWSDAAPGHYEVALVGHDGNRIEVEVSLAAFRESGKQTGALMEVRDLTEARRASETIRRMADYDRLTGLPNRELFDRHFQRAIIDARAGGQHVAVILFDLDRFKLINDTLGHPSGDRLLKAVADRLSKRLPSRHVLARFSGDEFLVLAPDLGGVPAAEGIAARLLEAFAEPFEHDGNQLQVSATAGVAVYPLHAEDPDTLIRIADAAVHAGKAEGGNRFQLGSDRADDPARRRLALEADLRRAVEHQEFEVYYQPQVDPKSGQVLGLEALLRWHHAERGPVSPGEFVPLLEETGLIVEVGDWILRQACRETQAWRTRGFPRLRVAVNLAPRQFLVPDLERRVRLALEESGLPPEALELELTESAGTLNLDAVEDVLERLSAIGVTTAIDDFGIGHSWLGRLRQLPIRTLKVDRSFIAGMAASVNDMAIVEAVVALGHALGLSVVAEGVENEGQLDVVRAIGCDLIQGFYFAPAVPSGQVVHMLAGGFAVRHVAA